MVSPISISGIYQFPYAVNINNNAAAVSSLPKKPAFGSYANENNKNDTAKTMLLLGSIAALAIGGYYLFRKGSPEKAKNAGRTAREALSGSKNPPKTTTTQPRPSGGAENAGATRDAGASVHSTMTTTTQQPARIGAGASSLTVNGAPTHSVTTSPMESSIKPIAQQSNSQQQVAQQFPQNLSTSQRGVSPQSHPEQKVGILSDNLSAPPVKGLTEDARKIAERQQKFEQKIDFAKDFVEKYSKELDEVLIHDGKIKGFDVTKPCDIAINELIKPYNGQLGTLYHGTTPESKANILKNGFSQRIAPKNGYLDGIGGTYFSLKSQPGAYGDSIIEATFNGKVAEVDTDILQNIKCYIKNIFGVSKLIKDQNITVPSNIAMNIEESIIREYLKQKFINAGYTGILGSKLSQKAGCKYFTALDPTCIQIIK